MGNTYDVIIIGGGPAGSTAGYILGKAGLKVLIIDKSKFPRHKLCAGCITHKTTRLLERVFGETVADLKGRDVINYASDRYEIYYKDKLLTGKNLNASFHFVERYKYDNFLLRKAEDAGAGVIEGEGVLSIDPSNNEILTSSGKTFTAKFLLGADGINSVVRRQFPEYLFDQKAWRQNLATGLEIFINRPDMENLSHPSLYFDFVNYGYAWAFPNRDKIIVGIGGLVQKNRRQFMPAFNKFLAALNLGALTTNNVKGFIFPYGNFLLNPVYKNIFLVGDAAGFADPLLGEGIFYAQRSAELASQSIVEAMKGNNGQAEAQKAAGEKYLQLLHEHIYPELVYAGKIRDFIFTRLNKFHYLPLKIIMNMLGTKPGEAVHGIRSYRWLRKNSDENGVGGVASTVFTFFEKCSRDPI
ncbi:MAG: geranylgeranyl reductase family protein [Nitrospirae bacterium]|nr:geranylgeranyl reductase family protein [Nitrospirota bacterium]